jgi:hypothetical protein
MWRIETLGLFADGEIQRGGREAQFAGHYSAPFVNTFATCVKKRGSEFLGPLD